MSRFQDTLMRPGVGPAAGMLNPALSSVYGGMNGLAPDFTQWISAQAYLQKNLIPFVVEYPKGFDYLPDADRRAWIAAYKAIIELHPQSITGFNSGIEVETTENAVGGGGQFFEDFTDAKEGRSQPQFNWIEKYGMSIGNFWSVFIRTFMMNPYTKYPDIMTMAGISRPVDQLADLYSGTVLFVEPDSTMLNPVNAYLCTNFWPKGTGEITGKRDLTQASESRTIDIQFAAMTQQGLGVRAFARSILQSVQISGANPWNAPSFVTQIDPAIQTAGSGYKANVENLGARAVQM
jgi:hypothetical protein